MAATVSKPSEICCEVVRDQCEIKHSKEPQQQEITKYKEVCDVPDDVIVDRSSLIGPRSAQQSESEGEEKSTLSVVDFTF